MANKIADYVVWFMFNAVKTFSVLQVFVVLPLFLIITLFSGDLEDKLLGFQMQTESAIGLFICFMFVKWYGFTLLVDCIKDACREYRWLKDEHADLDL